MTISLAERMRAFGWFLIAMFYAVLVQVVASHAARGLSPGVFFEPARVGILLFLLLLGFWAMGMVGQAQRSPLRSMGLVRRTGWRGELALGAALGWGGMVACVLPIAVFGQLVLRFDITAHQALFFGVDLVVLAVGALAEEVVFRGYPFQRLIEATGPFFATGLISVVFMAAHLFNPDSSAAGLFATLLAGWLLALAYLRTRALWVSWGFHFAWNASMGLLFGLPVSGLTIFSPVVSSYTRGPVWLTGGGYGPEGGAIAAGVLIVLLLVLTRSTRELKYRYGGPVIIAGGMPVDIDALSRRQHAHGMGPAVAPAGAQLVQILGAGTPAPLPPGPSMEEGSGTS